MDASPPGGRGDRPPPDRTQTELFTYDDGPNAFVAWVRERSPLAMTVVLLGLVAVTVGIILSWPLNGPEAPPADTFTGPPTTPSTAPATSQATPATTAPASTSDLSPAATPSGGPPSDVAASGDEEPVRAPERLLKVDGDQQTSAAAGLLEGLVVRVTDAAGNPVSGVQVLFQPESENGLVAPSRPRTDSLGFASTRWRLGSAVGVQRLNADVLGATVPRVTFTATALGNPDEAEEPAPTVPDSVPADSVEADPEPEPEPVVVVRRAYGVGGTFVCSVASGRAACRGANDRGQLGGGGGVGFQGLTVGVSHACALDGSGAAWCWGANDGGQLGDGSRTDRPVPVRVATELRFSILAAGAGHTCGLTSGGRAACWGRNLSGQLGDGTREDRATPTPLPGDRSFQTIVAGWEHTCGLSATGELACWGGNAQGQLGDGGRVARPAPTAVPGAFRSVVAGSRHTCGISGGQVLCWGDNSFGQLGDGSTETRARPDDVVGLPALPSRLAAGAVHTCALLEDASAWCWGQNVHGQLGDGTNQNRDEPVRVAGELEFSSLYAGGALTCGFTTDGEQYCWGLNQAGQLGDGTRENRASPARVGGQAPSPDS